MAAKKVAVQTTQAVAAQVAKISNTDFWDMARRFSPDFKQHTAKATEVEFSEKGFEAIKLSGTQVLNEFFNISMRIAFQLMNVVRAKNPLADKGLVQVYDTPNGGFVQRMAVNAIKPVSPAFKDLQDGQSVDPFIVRKPEVSERFFQMNFDYQSIITMQDYQYKTMFINEFGMGELLSGILSALASGYTVQEYLNTKECMHAALSSANYPLQDTQKITMDTWTGDGTTEELENFILALKDLATDFETEAITGAFNSMKYESAVDASDMVLVLRRGIKNRIDVRTKLGAFNPEYLSLPFEIVEISDFGGLEHYKESTFDTPLYPVYNKLGEQIGWNEAKDQSTVTVENGKDFVKDPHEDILGIVAQKGMIFENAQNPYEVTPIFNPRGLYTNYIANRPNNGINYDPLYNLITISKPSE